MATTQEHTTPKDTKPPDTLTVRDQFALAVLSGLLQGPRPEIGTLVSEAFVIADAMLAARKPA